jgi:hypothetical protein
MLQFLCTTHDELLFILTCNNPSFSKMCLQHAELSVGNSTFPVMELNFFLSEKRTKNYYCTVPQILHFYYSSYFKTLNSHQRIFSNVSSTKCMVQSNTIWWTATHRNKIVHTSNTQHCTDERSSKSTVNILMLRLNYFSCLAWITLYTINSRLGYLLYIT